MQIKTLILAAAAALFMYHYPQKTKDFIVGITHLNKEQLALSARGFPFGFVPLLSPIGVYKSLFIESTPQAPQARKAFNNGMLAGFAALCILVLYKPFIAVAINIAALAGLIFYPTLRNSEIYQKHITTVQTAHEKLMQDTHRT